MLASKTTTITSDPGILCFHHCNVKVFCFKLPHICPNCNAELVAAAAATTTSTSSKTNSIINSNSKFSDDASSTSASKNNDKSKDDDDDDDADDGDDDDADEVGDCNDDDDNVGHVVTKQTPSTTATVASSKLLPFRLPYPFVRATQYPCAIILRPSSGDFLNDYNNATDLHIAVTTSGGDIVEFDRDGLQRHRREDNPSEWWQTLLVGDVPEPWYDYWDDVLAQICSQSTRWSIARYEEVSHNCYTFVLAFLQALGYAKLSEAAHSKTSFCEKYIVPRTTTAGKYISLYRKLRVAGIYVHHQQQRQQHQQHHRHHNHHQQNNTNKTVKQTMRTNGFINGGVTTIKTTKKVSMEFESAATPTATATTTASVSSSKVSTNLTSAAYTHSIISRPRTHKLCTIEE